MRTFWRVFAALMTGLPLVAAWIWWWDGAWDNGAMTTKGLLWTALGCSLALLFFAGKVWADRK